MARLCVLMCVFAFGLSFAPRLFTPPAGIPSSQRSPADRLAGCAAACDRYAATLEGEAAKPFKSAAHFCSACAELDRDACPEFRKICAEHLVACVVASESDDREAASRCTAACRDCLDLLRSE